MASETDQNALLGQGAFTQDQLHVDVAEIGAGIAGLSAAYHMILAGRSVAVIDERLIGSGEATAHSANALDEHDVQLEKLHRRAGAHLAAESHAAAIADKRAGLRVKPVSGGGDEHPVRGSICFAHHPATALVSTCVTSTQKSPSNLKVIRWKNNCYVT